MTTPAPKKTNAGDRRFITIVGVLLAVGVALISYVVAKGKPVATVVAEPTDTSHAPPSAAATPSTGPGSVKRGGYTLGSDTALVEIVEHADFECPACGAFAREYEKEVREKLVNTGQVRFRYVDFPFPQHPTALPAHNAAACAAEQGKFWEMHDRLYEGQTDWSRLVHGKH
jgi:protein-disulfide isomerase